MQHWQFIFYAIHPVDLRVGPDELSTYAALHLGHHCLYIEASSPQRVRVHDEGEHSYSLTYNYTRP